MLAHVPWLSHLHLRVGSDHSYQYGCKFEDNGLASVTKGVCASDMRLTVQQGPAGIPLGRVLNVRPYRVWSPTHSNVLCRSAISCAPAASHH